SFIGRIGSGNVTSIKIDIKDATISGNTLTNSGHKAEAYMGVGPVVGFVDKVDLVTITATYKDSKTPDCSISGTGTNSVGVNN
ncbi:MAG: hypothetical protein MR471_07220, partial [Clostridia bacterium]|nr:hypothetical protein [Clostridia bacterium]